MHEKGLAHRDLKPVSKVDCIKNDGEIYRQEWRKPKNNGMDNEREELIKGCNFFIFTA